MFLKPIGSYFSYPSSKHFALNNFLIYYQRRVISFSCNRVNLSRHDDGSESVGNLGESDRKGVTSPDSKVQMKKSPAFFADIPLNTKGNRPRNQFRSAINSATRLEKLNSEYLKFYSKREKRTLSPYPTRSLTAVIPQQPYEDVGSQTILKVTKFLISEAQENSCLSLSAPRFNIPLRLLVYRPNPLPNTSFHVWWDPIIETDASCSVEEGSSEREKTNSYFGMWETCVSCGGNVAWIKRPPAITVSGADENGVKKKRYLDGLSARLLMHELDHLNGISFFHLAEGSEFIMPLGSLLQKNMWKTDYPSKEAAETGFMEMYDFKNSKRFVIGGCELFHTMFSSSRC